MRSAFEQIIPFIVLGIFLAVGVVILYMLANAIIIGAIIGMLLYAVNWIIEKVQHKPNVNSASGRIIEHD